MDTDPGKFKKIALKFDEQLELCKKRGLVVSNDDRVLRWFRTKPGKNVQTALQSTDGGVTFNVNVQVDMAEFATWRPERISAFFRGIAEVLAAKADVEKGGTLFRRRRKAGWSLSNAPGSLCVQ